VELVENFRSRPDILHAVESGGGGRRRCRGAAAGAGLSFPGQGEAVGGGAGGGHAGVGSAVGGRAHFGTRRPIAVARRVAEFRDFAVLVRNSEVLAEFTRAFDDFGIPYLVNRGKGFYETREVVDLMHLLRVLANPRDEISMAAVLRSPFVQASDEALLRLFLPRQSGQRGGTSRRHASASVRHGDAEKLAYFRDQLARWRATRDYTAIDQLLLRAMDECGYECPAGPRGAANIEKFLAQARAASARQTLAEFVEEIEILRESKPREPDAPPEDSANAVKIMTVHAAKGLEFPVVFLAAMHKGIDAKPGAISFSPRIGAGRALASSAGPGRQRRCVPARYPAGAQAARKGRGQPVAVRGHDPRRRAPGAVVLDEWKEAAELGGHRGGAPGSAEPSNRTTPRGRRRANAMSGCLRRSSAAAGSDRAARLASQRDLHRHVCRLPAALLPFALSGIRGHTAAAGEA
jgi:hypothetical protein